MKKLILAAAIASVTAGTASAATVYEGNGLSYDLEGELQIQLREAQRDGANVDVEFDTVELMNVIQYRLNDDYTAIGEVSFAFEDKLNDSNEDSATVTTAVVGLARGDIQVVVGKTDLAGDEFGIEQAYAGLSAEDGFDAVATDGDDVIRVDAKVGNVDVVASYEFRANNESSQNGRAFDIFVATEVGGVALAAAYQNFSEMGGGADSGDTLGVSASFDAGVATLAADFTTTDRTAGDTDILNLVVSLPIDANTGVALGYVDTDAPGSADDSEELYANITYTFPNQENVSVFAEVQDFDGTNGTTGYLMGAYIAF